MRLEHIAEHLASCTTCETTLATLPQEALLVQLRRGSELEAVADEPQCRRLQEAVKQLFSAFTGPSDLSDARRLESAPKIWQSKQGHGHWWTHGLIAATMLGVIVALVFATIAMRGDLPPDQLAASPAGAFRWQPLLASAPVELLPAADFHRGWFYDKELGEVHINSRTQTILQLGETNEGSFSLSVDITKIVPGGSAGLVFGFHETEPNEKGERRWRYQRITMQTSGSTDVLARDDFEIVNHGTFYSTHQVRLGSAVFPKKPIRDVRLEVTIIQEQVHEVKWDGQPLPSVCNEKHERSKCRGIYGIESMNGTSIFSGARFILMGAIMTKRDEQKYNAIDVIEPPGGRPTGGLETSVPVLTFRQSIHTPCSLQVRRPGRHAPGDYR